MFAFIKIIIRSNFGLNRPFRREMLSLWWKIWSSTISWWINSCQNYIIVIYKFERQKFYLYFPSNKIQKKSSSSFLLFNFFVWILFKKECCIYVLVFSKIFQLHTLFTSCIWHFPIIGLKFLIFIIFSIVSPYSIKPKSSVLGSISMSGP